MPSLPAWSRPCSASTSGMTRRNCATSSTGNPSSTLASRAKSTHQAPWPAARNRRSGAPAGQRSRLIPDRPNPGRRRRPPLVGQASWPVFLLHGTTGGRAVSLDGDLGGCAVVKSPSLDAYDQHVLRDLDSDVLQ